ncbi:MAG: hypothetical protein CUN55_15840 [Phototrophicales bacterium]|nr:MAG: hypothetical protein CUN55_15840 [Phototrophicales bacterium]
MGFQDQLVDFISNQLNDYRLGNSYPKAVADASKFSSVSGWVNQERNIVATTGAASSILPGLHGATMVADIGLLLHKSARLGWGVGEILDAVPHESEEMSDLENILAIWGDQSKYDRRNITYRAVGIDVVHYFATEEGRNHADNLVEKAEREGELLLFRTLTVAQLMAYSITDLKIAKITEIVATHAASSTANRAGQGAIKKATQKSASKIARKSAIKQSKKAVTKGISKKVATKTASRFGARIGVRAFAGFIPFVGAAVAAGLNAWTITSMKDAAVAYYEDALTRNELDSI